MCRALIYIKCELNLGRENQTVCNSTKRYDRKSLCRSYSCYCEDEKGVLDFSWCWIQSVVDLWRGFWAKLLVHKQLLRVLINVNWCVNGHCDLWKTPPWESRGCSLILFSVLFFPPVLSENSCHSRNAPQHCLPTNWIMAANLTSPGLLWAFVFEAMRHRALTFWKRCLEYDCTQKRMC